MERMIDVIETTIPKGRTLRIQDGKGLELKVVTGRLWVAQEDDPNDAVLDATESYRLNRGGLTLVHAFKAVQLQITYPAQAGAPSITVGGGYREVGSSVVSTIFGEWMREVRGWFVAGVRERALRSGRMWA
jgi:hypothetical protein